jgi:hypothetical protein
MFCDHQSARCRRQKTKTKLDKGLAERRHEVQHMLLEHQIAHMVPRGAYLQSLLPSGWRSYPVGLANEFWHCAYAAGIGR